MSISNVDLTIIGQIGNKPTLFESEGKLARKICKQRVRCRLKAEYSTTAATLNNRLANDLVNAIYKRVLLKQKMESNKVALDELVESLQPKKNEKRTESNFIYFMKNDQEQGLLQIMTKSDFIRLVVYYIHNKQVIF